MAANNLTEDIKRFIVKSLAIYETPSDVAESVKAKFNRKVTRQNVHAYDPTKVAGEDLSAELKDLFFATRKEFEEKEIIPVSKKIVRLKKLGKYVEAFENLENYVAAAAVLEQIAKEVGDAFTNKFKVDQNIQAQHSVVRVPPKTSAEEWSKQVQQSPSEK